MKKIDSAELKVRGRKKKIRGRMLRTMNMK